MRAEPTSRPRRRLRLLLRGAALCALLAPSSAAARPRLCLPPVYEGGRRLHQMPSPSVSWLELAMRQHELCWRRSDPGEVRIALLGSSAVFGFPLSVEQTFGALVNDHFGERGTAARLYNLAWVNPYQLRDAMILHEALRYDTNVVVYAITPSDFVHQAPVIWPTLLSFFASNSDVLAAFVADPPPGLAEPVSTYGRWLNNNPSNHGLWPRFRETGRFVRTASRIYAQSAARALHPAAPLPPAKQRHRQTQYDCSRTHADVERSLRQFADWNVLAYLEQERRRSGIEVLVVHWPIAHEPVEDCYNVRFTEQIVPAFEAWLSAETAKRGLHYLDLHDLLPSDRFLDSVHVGAEGHALIAARVAEALDPLVERTARRVSGAARR